MVKKWCKWFGHKWIPVVIVRKGNYKFFGCYCSECNIGHKELLDFSKDYRSDICSYSLKYFNDELNNFSQTPKN